VSVYGTDASCTAPTSFSRLSTPEDSRLGCPVRLRSRLDGGCPRIYAVRRPIHTAAPPLFQCPLGGHHVHKAGPESSPAVHRLRLWGLALGSASPCADHHGAGILGLSVLEIFTLVCAYSFRHPHFWSLQGNGSPAPSLFPERSPTPDQPDESAYQGHASAGRLIPTILGAFTLDW
jgi:hypothetical protein